MNNENFQEPEVNPWTPVMILWGSKDKLGTFMENEKNLNSVLKDVLNVFIGLLERGFYV